MKKKIITLTLCFTLIFSSLNINKSHADSRSALSLAGYVITKETFNVIVGLGALCGITALSVDSGDFSSSAGDFVERVLDEWTSLKVDSGEFYTVDDIEKEIKNGSSKDPKDPSKIVLGSSLIATLTGLFDKVSKNEQSGIFSKSGIPFFQNYYDFTSEIPSHDSGKYLKIPLPGGRFANLQKTVNDGWTKVVYYDSSTGEMREYNTNTYMNLTFFPCEKKSFNFCDTHETHGDPNYYHVGAKRLNQEWWYTSTLFTGPFYISTLEEADPL